MDRPERLIQAFKQFDANNTGRVSTDAMKILLTSMGNPFSKEEINEFVADADENGTIDYRRFVNSVIFGV
jgi:Ca2+-binding EF-hand superfamily protein